MRAWVSSALAVGVAVAAYLLLTGDEPRSPGAPPPAAVPLKEREVRDYLAVFPEFYARLGKAAQEFDPARAPESQESYVADLARRHNMTVADLHRLRRRVEHAVESVRWDRSAGTRQANVRAAIQEKQILFDTAKGKTKETLQADLARLKAQLDAPGPAAPEADKELVRRFWTDLDALAPKPFG
ncbi:MAG: hypothetical protein ACREID_08820 [Planctomycetota bacterium]